jgi:large subunit ribosomal protein L30
MAQLKIKLVKSTIGKPSNQKLTAKALGLTKLQRSVTKPDNPHIRGMVATIAHLVDVEEVK